MCRFVFYLGEPLTLDALTTRPIHSLIHQSYQSRERAEPLNGDGFGIAWYVAHDEEPALYRSTTPAWSDPNLREIARVTRSGCVLAHVRAATPPMPVTIYNCHPFKAGKLALMHNGYIPGFTGLRRRIQETLSDAAFDLIKGTTDSEHLLAMFHDRYQHSQGSDAERLAWSLERTLIDVEALCQEHGIDEAPRLNVVVSDGRSAAVSRYCRDADHADSLYLERRPASVMVASEALSADDGWEKVPVDHVLSIDPERRVTLRPRP